MSRLTQVLAGAMSPEQVPSAATLFSHKMWQVQGLTCSEANEYRGMTVFRLQNQQEIAQDNLENLSLGPTSSTNISIIQSSVRKAEPLWAM